MSQRKKVRIKRRLSAEFDNNGITVRGIIRNFTEIGVFVQTKSFLPIGSTITLRFTLDEKNQKGPIELQGRVVSVRNDPMMRMVNTTSSGGMGVSLNHVPEVFSRYVASLRGQDEPVASTTVIDTPTATTPIDSSVQHAIGNRSIPSSGTLGSNAQAYLVPEILIGLWRQEFTGMLRLQRGMLHKVIYLKKGHAVFIESTLDSDKLGQYLIKRGSLSQGALEIALNHQHESKTSLGQILLDRGFIDATALMEGLCGQQEDKITNTFTWFDGGFQQATMVAWPEQIAIFPHRTPNLVIAGVQKWYDTQVVRWLIPNAASTRFKHNLKIDAGVQLPAKLMRIYHELTAPLTLQEIAVKLGVASDELLSSLYVLLVFGYLKIN